VKASELDGDPRSVDVAGVVEIAADEGNDPRVVAAASLTSNYSRAGSCGTRAMGVRLGCRVAPG
jgi:hypothetical protein